MDDRGMDKLEQLEAIAAQKRADADRARREQERLVIQEIEAARKGDKDKMDRIAEERNKLRVRMIDLITAQYVAENDVYYEKQRQNLAWEAQQSGEVIDNPAAWEEERQRRQEDMKTRQKNLDSLQREKSDILLNNTLPADAWMPDEFTDAETREERAVDLGQAQRLKEEREALAQERRELTQFQVKKTTEDPDNTTGWLEEFHRRRTDLDAKYKAFDQFHTAYTESLFRRLKGEE